MNRKIILGNDSNHTLIRKGKVRDLYDIGYGLMLIRHSDRVSSFDKVWCDIEGKGTVLNSTAVWWFNRTNHIVPNHLIYASDNSKDMIVKSCEVFPIEFVVRGYITGSTQTSLWTHYHNGEREYCGLAFPNGLRKNQKLSKPVVTPTIKGDEDIPISAEQIVHKGYMTEQDWMYCSSIALELFEYGQQVARGSGLILVDTKYEFGRDEKTGEILLIDEIHTCDSSRYWKLDTYTPRYQAGIEPERFDKDLIRTYVKSQCNPYETKPSDVTIPQDIKDTVRNVYLEFYKILTGYQINPEVASVKTVEELVDKYYEKYHTNRVYIMYDSEYDRIHAIKIQRQLLDLDVYSVMYSCDAYKNTKELLKYLDTKELKRKTYNHSVIYITVCGKSNSLSEIVACNTNSTVVACPSFIDKIDMVLTSGSTLQVAPVSPVLTILDPCGVAIAVNRIFN